MARPLAQMTVNGKQERVLLLAPTGRDAQLTQKILAEVGICSSICKGVEEFCRELDSGTGAALVTEEALTEQSIGRLVRSLDRQPAWSDIPVILFATNSESAGLLLNRLGQRANIIVLERPINISVLTGAVRSALRARRRQYQTRDLLIELEEADRQKDLFLATISHEIRTPLNAIMGWAEILNKNHLDEATAQRAASAIERNARSQSQLIEDILDMSRIIRGNLRLTAEPLDPIPVILAAIEVVRPAAIAKNIHIETLLESSGAVISGDASRLQQVVWNLLSNAIKFTPEGGRVHIRLLQDETHITIEVSDTGKGINPDFLPHVFDYFRQADNSITRTHGGLGLGLAIVRHLVELHGGTAHVTSEGADRGATFTIILPLMSAQRRPPLAAVVPATNDPESPNLLSLASYPSLQGLKILVVDDAADTIELMTEIFAQCGSNVATASSAAEALDLLQQQDFDLLISDIGMPQRDGYSLIQEIRAKEALQGRKIPAVALTAHARAADRIRALSAGYDTHLTKPVEISELLAVVAGLTR